MWAQYDELARSEANAVPQIPSDPEFAVFETRGDFRKEDVAIGEIRVATDN